MSTVTRLALTCTSLVVLGAALAAQGMTPPKPMPPMERPQAAAASITSSMKFTYDYYKTNYVAAAAEMPLEGYGFRPQTLPAADHKEVRTFSQLIGHIAQENFQICAAAEGKPQPAGTGDIEQAKDSKVDLTKALGDSFAYCDRVWAATTDKNAGMAVDLPFNMGPSTRIGVLMFSAAHDAEHYGNVVTYLRAKGLVPPSSAPGK